MEVVRISFEIQNGVAVESSVELERDGKARVGGRGEGRGAACVPGAGVAFQ